MTILHDPDTIAAIATANGRGGIGIIRLSGDQAKIIAEKMTRQSLTPRHAHFTRFYNQNHDALDEGITLFFSKPHSFTGEDVVELQGHGGIVVMNMLLKTAIQHGARLARPGEFSERAFFNRKIDLSQAEAIADLINANSEQAARSAIRSLQGEFSKKIQTLQEQLTYLRMQIEAMLDFPEEEIDLLENDSVRLLLEKTTDALLSVKKQATQGVLLQNGLTIVIAGKPNAGKSSLLNYLSGRDSAIVTEIPGTTRDILREFIQLDGMPLHVLDTAGLRETMDVIEQEGVRRAYRQMSEADLILFMIDARELQQYSIEHVIFEFQKVLSAKKPILVIKNKIDLTNEEPKIISQDHLTIIQLSIRQNKGVTELIDYLKRWAGFQSSEETQFIARQRHVDAIDRTYSFLLRAKEQLNLLSAQELIAEDLRQAQLTLSEITGEVTSDDLLGQIFSNFCIGK